MFTCKPCFFQSVDHKANECSSCRNVGKVDGDGFTVVSCDFLPYVSLYCIYMCVCVASIYCHWFFPGLLP